VITTLNAIAPIFLIIVLGHLLYRTRIAGEQVWSAIEHICFYLLLPALIVRTLSRANLTSVPILDFMLVLVTAIAGMSFLLILMHHLLRFRFPDSGPTFTSLFQGATRFHGFVAIAIIGPLYGENGITLAALALAIMIPVLNIANVIVLTIYGSNDSTANTRQILLRIVTNPLIIGCAVGLFLNWTGTPDILFDTINIIGNGGLGLTLLAVGAGLRLDQIAADKLLVTVGVLTRLIGMPLVVIAMASLMGLDGLPRTIAIIAGAVPTAGSAYVMARKMGGNAELMSNILTFQVIVSFVTLPLFIYIAGNY
jgi:malonate transporter